jgi:uncharacterized protein YdaT
MKLTKKYIDNLAEKWSDAYRADFNGREVSIEIIKAMLDFGLTENQAAWVYRSKHLRWFFDSNSDCVHKTVAKEKFSLYLESNRNDILEDIKTCI